MIPDNEQRRISQEFAAAVTKDPTAIAQSFLDKFNYALSPELASRMCPVYNERIQFRGYYRAALTATAQRILDRAWTLINAENKSERKPVLFIVGGGPGSLCSELLEQIPTKILTHTKCVYDITSLSVSRADDLVRRTLQQQTPIIAAYVHVPLPQAAHFTITTSLTEGLLPSAADFSARHLSCYHTFLALIKRYRKKNALFSYVLLLASNDEIAIDIGAQKLKRIAANPNTAERLFLQTWNNLQISTESQVTEPADQAPRVKRPRPFGKNPLRAKTADTACILARSLSTILHVKTVEARSENKSLPNPVPTSRGVADNAKGLTHDRAFASNQLLENATGWTEKTQPGQDKLLNEERPLRIEVQEKKTHEHEMQIVYTR